MSKQHVPGPVPPGNRPQSGPQRTDKTDPTDEPAAQTEGDSEQDPKRRIGGFVGKGEHARQQPGPLNDGGKSGK